MKIITLSDIKKVLALSLTTVVSFSVLTVLVEPVLAQGSTSASSTVVVTLGVDTGISITNPGNTSMSVDIGVSTNSAVATSTFTVATNNNIGYTLTVQATSTPAMKNATNSIPDATTTPSTWAVPSNSYQFGFSAFGTDVPTGTWGTGVGCQGATSTPSTTLKYRGFVGATPITIASNAATTTVAGTTSTVCYAAAQNNSYIPSGSYNATVTATATTN